MEGADSENTYVIFLLFLSVVGTLENLVVLVTILGTKKLRNVSSVFLVNLATCDLLTSAVSIPCVVGLSLGSPMAHAEVLCSAVGLISNIMWGASLLTLALIAFERYYAIVYCFRYASLTSYRHIQFGVSVVWIVPVVTMCGATFGWPQQTVSPTVKCLFILDKTSLYSVVVVCVNFIIPLLITFFSYVRILMITKHHTNRIDVSLKPTGSPNKISTQGTVAAAFVDTVQGVSMLSPQQTNRVKRVAFSAPQDSEGENDHIFAHVNGSKKFSSSFVKLSFLTLSICTCCGPYFVLSLIINYMSDISFDLETSKKVSSVLCYSGSVINPLLYAIYSQRFRLALRNLLRKSTCRPAQVSQAVVVPFNIDSTMFVASQFYAKTRIGRNDTASRLPDLPEERPLPSVSQASSQPP